MGKIRIKICGLYRDCDVEWVNRWKPDYAGFVCYPPSHRYVTREQIRAFRNQLSPEIPAVGVFVNEPVESVAAYLTEGILQIAQLHGQEDEAYISELRKLAPDGRIWKAYKIRSEEDLKQAEASAADRVLLDNGYGTGKCFDWGLLSDHGLKREFLLAGGLSPENAEEAVRAFHPWGIDVSSGVETDRKKDPEKIRQMIEKIRRL
jgi:phosphoribosylanthranilate isomerase